MKIRNTLLLLFAFLYAAMAFAQKEPPVPQKNPSVGAPGLQVPIDDYIPLLIPVGLVLGIYLLGFSENTKREFPEDV